MYNQLDYNQLFSLYTDKPVNQNELAGQNACNLLSSGMCLGIFCLKVVMQWISNEDATLTSRLIEFRFNRKNEILISKAAAQRLRFVTVDTE